MIDVDGGTDSVIKFLAVTRSDEQGSRKYCKCETVGRCDIIITNIIVIITDIVIMYNMSLTSAATSVNWHSLW
jgi:hypothetical protein